MTKTADTPYFKHSSLYEVGFLLTKNLELVGIEPTDNPHKYLFVLKDTDVREFLLDRFRYAKENDPEVMVDSRRFTSAIKQLRQLLRQELSI